MRGSGSSTRWAAATLGLLLAAAPWTAALAQSAVRGQTLFESRCVACHSLNENRIGPALQNVVGRAAGTAKNYDYSPALAAAKHRWNRDLLLAWLTDPETVVAGQRMGYRVEAPADREDLVAYLYAQGTGARRVGHLSLHSAEPAVVISTRLHRTGHQDEPEPPIRTGPTPCGNQLRDQRQGRAGD